MVPSQSFVRNCLLSALTPSDFALLQPHLYRAPLHRLQRLVKPDEPIETICFPEGGVVSIVTIGPGGKRTEVGIFGCEGMSGVAVLLGSDRTPFEIYVQVNGTTALYISTASLVAAIETSPTLRALLLRYAYVQAVQLASAVMTLSQYTTEQRLARWLLMCHDRLDGDGIAITHEFLGMMLGVRRAGVTDAMHELEGNQLVRGSRGHVAIRDRPRLLKLAGASYGEAEAEYRRLIGPLRAEGLAAAPVDRGWPAQLGS